MHIYIYIYIYIYAGSTITNFQSKKMPKEKVPCKCLSIIMLDSVIKAKKKYYSQMKNKHNQKLINIILENQKIYGGFLKILMFRVSLSRMGETRNISILRKPL